MMFTQTIVINLCKQEIPKLKKLTDRESSKAHLADIRDKIKIAELLLSEEKKFVSLSYSAKLKFWNVNSLPSHTWCYFIAKDENETHKKFAIHPETAEERRHYFRWVIPHLKKSYPLLYDLDAMKENYFSKSSGNPQALEYTEKEITKFKNQRGHYLIRHREPNSTYTVNYSDHLNAFKEGYDSVVDSRELSYNKNILVFRDIPLIQQGIVCAHFLPFLEIQKKRLEYELQNLTLKNPESENPLVENHSAMLKLKWNGQQNILIDIFYQMKHKYNSDRQPLLPNSNAEVALFLKNNFECFEDVALSTIEGQLRKSQRPRKEEKRILIPE